MRTTQEILEAARNTVPLLSHIDASRLDGALLAIADELESHATQDAILRANAEDLDAATGISPVMLDRLRLTPDRIRGMAEGIRKVASLPSPLGHTLATTVREDGLTIVKKSVAIGGVAIIYESRPNVTSDAAALALKSGNVSILRGGKEAARSNAAIVDAIRRALARVGLPEDAVLRIEDVSRESANALMKANGYVDLLIPRGGAGLIRACVENATVPCIETGTGICHVYVDRDANLDKALAIIENAKTSRPSVCNAEEVCLVHRDIAEVFLPLLRVRLEDERRAAGKPTVEFRTDPRAHAIMGGTPAGEGDFDTEFLDYILAVAVVDSAEDAIEHIRRHSSHHSDAIVTENAEVADRFTALVDSAAVYVNASTRFTDGGEFGLGCEMGISTQKLHARGPMGLAELTTYKYIVRGNGHVR